MIGLGIGLSLGAQGGGGAPPAPPSGTTRTYLISGQFVTENSKTYAGSATVQET